MFTGLIKLNGQLNKGCFSKIALLPLPITDSFSNIASVALKRLQSDKSLISHIGSPTKVHHKFEVFEYLAFVCWCCVWRWTTGATSCLQVEGMKYTILFTCPIKPSRPSKRFSSYNSSLVRVVSLQNCIVFFHPISQHLSPSSHSLLFCLTTIRLTFPKFSSQHCDQQSSMSPSCSLETIWTPRPVVLDSSQHIVSLSSLKSHDIPMSAHWLLYHLLNEMFSPPLCTPTYIPTILQCLFCSTPALHQLVLHIVWNYLWLSSRVYSPGQMTLAAHILIQTDTILFHVQIFYFKHSII